MNLADARALTKALINGTGWKCPDDYVINKVLDVCNDYWWKQIARAATSLVMIDSPDTMTDGTGVYDYSGSNLNANGVYLLVAVEAKFLGRYIKLDYELPSDRYIYNIAFGQVQALIPSAYTLIGEKINLLPKVNSAQALRIMYVPNNADLTADTQPLLNGILSSFTDIVAHDAAQKLVPAGMNASLKEDLRSHERQLNDFLTSRTRQDGRRIRYVPYE